MNTIQQQSPRVNADLYRSCVACGSCAIKYWRSKSYAYSSDKHGTSFDIYRCHECGSGFLNPPPTDEVLAEIYRHSGQALRAPVDPRRIIEREERFPNSTVDARRIVATARSLTKAGTGNALDIGSGYGFYTKQLIDSGYNTTSINPGEYENRVFREICGCEPLPIYFEDFSTTQQFDVVLMSQVLEHMKSPSQALCRIAGVLAEGGVFACAVPNFRSFSVSMRGVRDNGCLWVPEHVNYFTVAGLRSLVESAGLRVVHHEYVTRIPNHRVLHCLGLPANDLLLRCFEIGTSPFLWLADRLGYGICINLYAVKER